MDIGLNFKFIRASEVYFSPRWMQKEPLRYMWHFQYLSWPDHGVPNEPGGVLWFLEEVNRTQSTIPDTGPIVVHCRYRQEVEATR